MRDSLPPSLYPGRTTEKDQWAHAARTTPGGFGGLTAQGNERVLYLVDTSKRKDAVEALLAAGIIRPQDVRTATVRKARWTFAQLYDWYQYLNLHITLGEDVTARGIDEGQNRIYYAVRDANEFDKLQGTLKQLHVPCFLVFVDTSGTVRS